MSGRKVIGFDRDIQLEWLDKTAVWASQGLKIEEIRSNLDRLLEGKVKRSGQRSARDKTMTVLLHVWSQVPDALTPLRDEGLRMLPERTSKERLPLHWGMCIATYPFFRDVVAIIGRLLRLQGTVALTQLTRRATESWGERSTVIRAARRIGRSLVRWGILTESGERGVYLQAPMVTITNDDEVGPWLVEAGLSNCDGQARPLRSLLGSPELFPFSLAVSTVLLRSRKSLEIHRLSLDEEMVSLAVPESTY